MIQGRRPYYMVKQIANIALFCTLLILTCCEGGTTFAKTIYNKSQDTLIVKLYAFSGSLETVTINPNESELIYWDDQMGLFTDDSYDCTIELDSVFVTTTDNKNVKKDLMNPDNWTRESKDGRNSREDCTITITAGDIQ